MSSSLLIAKYTIIDYLKSKSLFAVLIISFFLFLVTFVSSQITYKTVDKVIIDIGFGLTAFFIYLSSIFWGQNLITDEIEKKTVHTILSRGIRRLNFFFGKFISLLGIILLNLSILSVFVLSLYWLFGGQFEMNIIHCLWGFYLAALILSGLATFFSFFMNGYLASILTASVYITSSIVASTLNTTYVKRTPIVEDFLIVLKYILPDFNKLNFTDYLLSMNTVKTQDLWYIFLYGVGYVFVLNFSSYLIFNKKELN